LQFVTNQLSNPEWAGASGSITGGDFVTPTGWNNSFWPPDECEVAGQVEGNNQLRFQVTDERGFITQQMQGVITVGEPFVVSVFVDEVTVAGLNRPVHVTVTGGNVEIIKDPGPVNRTGEFTGTYRALVDASTLIRIGAGTATADTADFVVSRPSLLLAADADKNIDQINDLRHDVYKSSLSKDALHIVDGEYDFFAVSGIPETARPDMKRQLYNLAAGIPFGHVADMRYAFLRLQYQLITGNPPADDNQDTQQDMEVFNTING
jgi:hypothetical protein